MRDVFGRIGRLWRTVRHLKPIQILGRARLALMRPRPDLRPAPALRGSSGPWVEPPPREPTLVGPQRLRLLNQEHELDAIKWDDAALPLLWRYHLHYFDDLNARDAEARKDWHRVLIDRWIRENPPGIGTGWAPYPVSLRIVNWIKWFLRGEAPRGHWLHSLAVQSRWLARRVEWHLLGNHLFANAKALAFAGLYFDGEEANQWLQQGLRIFERELSEQILPDGGHFERSPMYHALALEDMLDLLNLMRARPTDALLARRLQTKLRTCAQRMLYWLRCMCHPDGGIAFFNDAAHGMAPANRHIEEYAARLGIDADPPPIAGVTWLHDSGYVRVARGDIVALLDVAPVGPDYQPGHAHADTLSFELSCGTRRVVVNGGTSCYGTCPQRLRERGTAWHSTVEVAGQDSSEVWHSFRVGRRARVHEVRIAGWTVEAAHDGYRFLNGAPMHRRRWHFEDAALVVEDSVSPGIHPAVARYHLGPGLRIKRDEASAVWLVCSGGQVLARVQVEVGTASAARSEYAPCFGLREPIDTLEVVLNDGYARLRWQWQHDAHSVSD